MQAVTYVLDLFFESIEFVRMYKHSFKTTLNL